jgi:hypothetical protein
MSCWLQWLSASRDHELALGPLDQLSKQLDLPPAFEGAGLHSSEKSADKEVMGSFASISSALIFFCKK